jgi:GH43 family beta-xylosidase
MAAFQVPQSVPGQDPWIVPMEGRSHYLLVQSSAKNRIVGWEFKHFRFVREYVLWEPPRRSGHSRQVWAPELHEINGTYYIYFAASDGRHGNHRMYVLESRNLTGPYQEVGKICDPEHDVWAIDLTVFSHEGKMYAVWSGWENPNDGFPQKLYIAAMSDPVTLQNQRRLLTEPELDWEMSFAKVVEGPEVYRGKNGQLAILYAADASWTTSYKTGLLEWNGGPILAASSWVKRPQPLITNGGHGTVVTIDNQEWLVFHSKSTSDMGWANRVVCWTPFDSSICSVPATRSVAA